jgi:hypothetical protein
MSYITPSHNPTFNNYNTIKPNMQNIVQIFDFSRIIGSINNMKEPCQQYSKNVYEYVCEHKKDIMFYGGATSYVSLQSTLWYLEKKLNQETNWSQWNKHIKLENLYDMTGTTLSQKLLNDIQIAYIDPHNPVNFVQPLKQFIIDTEKEFMYISAYQTILSFLRKTYLSWIFFYDKELYDTLDEHRQRLQYIHKTFLGWLTDYKVTQSYKTKQTRNLLRKLCTE